MKKRGYNPLWKRSELFGIADRSRLRIAQPMINRFPGRNWKNSPIVIPDDMDIRHINTENGLF